MLTFEVRVQLANNNLKAKKKNVMFVVTRPTHFKPPDRNVFITFCPSFGPLVREKPRSEARHQNEHLARVIICFSVALIPSDYTCTCTSPIQPTHGVM